MSSFAFAHPRLPFGFQQPVTVSEDSVPVFNRDPSWVRLNELREARLVARRQALHDAEIPLLTDLAAIGLDFASIWSLVHARHRFPEAIPVLVRHLGGDYHPYIKEGIARALAAPEARGVAGRALLAALRAQPADDPAYLELRIALAQSLVIAADPAQRDGIGQLLAETAQELVHPILERALRTAQPRRQSLPRLAA